MIRLHQNGKPAFFNPDHIIFVEKLTGNNKKGSTVYTSGYEVEVDESADYINTEWEAYKNRARSTFEEPS